MKFRTGLIIGLGVGYVLGSRAGRERYDQLKSVVDSVAGNERVRKVAAVAGKSTEGARNLAGTGLVAAGGAVRQSAATGTDTGNGRAGDEHAETETVTRRWQTPRFRMQNRETTAVR
jgi:hypothetical protein